MKTLLSSIISVGYYERDKENLVSIAIAGQNSDVELIFIFDNQDVGSFEFEKELKFRKIEAKIINVHFNNPGDTRNAGIGVASGDYIHFCDADDFPLYGHMIEMLLQINPSFTAIVGSFETIDALNQIRKEKYCYNAKYFSLNPGIWRWIFKRESLREVCFPPIRLGEDQVFLVKYISKHKDIFFCNKTFYVYKVNQRKSLVSEASYESIKEAIDCMTEAIYMRREFKNPLSICVLFVKLNFSLIMSSKRKLREVKRSIIGLCLLLQKLFLMPKRDF